LEYNVALENAMENDSDEAVYVYIIRQFHGSDTEGTQFASVADMWYAQGITGDVAGRAAWYDRAATYYDKNCPPTIDGVLGGFASISNVDLAGSRQFVEDLAVMRPGLQLSSRAAACECGAGIGRVFKRLLLPLGVARCDLVAVSSRLPDTAPCFLGDELEARCQFYCTGLQDWDARPRLEATGGADVWVIEDQY
jgi:hypothetical protein